jgi:polar amino acid transport system permease protein
MEDDMTAETWELILESFTKILVPGLLMTIPLTVLSFAIAMVIAVAVALIQYANIPVLKQICRFYIWITRGTPLLVQLYIVFYGLFAVASPFYKLLPHTSVGFVDLDRFIPGIVALTMNSAAYLSETFRAGIQGIDYGQTEAARSLGMSSWQTMKMVVLPQAVKNMLPAIANEFVTIIKESSICSVLGMSEIMYFTKIVQGSTFIAFEPLLVAAALYFTLTFPTSKIIAHFERRMRRGDVR